MADLSGYSDGLASTHRDRMRDVDRQRASAATHRNRYVTPQMLAFACCAMLFSGLTVFVQVTDLSLTYLNTDQSYRHAGILDGRAGSPYQYRVLSEYLVEAVIVGLRRVTVADPVTTGFITFRLLQNATIFFLVALYYRTLGLNSRLTLIGLSLLTWGMTHSGYDSDLSFNLYSDIIFYVAGALAVLHGRPAFIIPIVGLAAFNRETSALIPMMLIVHSVYRRTNRALPAKDVVITVVAFVVYAAVFVGLRWYFGMRPLVLPYGKHPGMELFTYNVFRLITWTQLFATLGILPILALSSAGKWPLSVRAFFWAVVPIWTVVHLFMSVIAEARLFLVPLAIVFIPGALFGVTNGARQSAIAVAEDQLGPRSHGPPTGQ